jgi:hypothetical protein
MRAPLLVAAVVALAASDAAAHTRPAAVLGLALDANDADHLVIQMTSGLGISEDGGVSWSWICSDAVGFDNGFEDPPILVDGSGAIVFAGFDGLGRSSVDACDWSFEASALADEFVIDLAPEAGDPDRFLALRTSGAEPDRLYRSTDGGRSVLAVGEGLGELLTERVQVAASDPSRVYVSGFFPAVDGGRPPPRAAALLGRRRELHGARAAGPRWASGARRRWPSTRRTRTGSSSAWSACPSTSATSG